MKRTFLILLALSMIACSTNKATTFSYSGVFTINFPKDWILGSTVLVTDGLTLKTKRGNYIAGQIITGGIDGLPSDFDMRLYPELVLGIKEYTGSSKEFKEKLTNSQSVFKDAYDLNNIDIKHIDGTTRYNTCREKSCLSFVVKDSFPEHILMIFSEGDDQLSFDEIVNGAIYVK